MEFRTGEPGEVPPERSKLPGPVLPPAARAGQGLSGPERLRVEMRESIVSAIPAPGDEVSALDLPARARISLLEIAAAPMTAGGAAVVPTGWGTAERAERWGCGLLERSFRFAFLLG